MSVSLPLEGRNLCSASLLCIYDIFGSAIFFVLSFYFSTPPRALLSRYLHFKGVDFAHKNKGGNDPLNHAVAYGRRDIAAWLLGLANPKGAPSPAEQGGFVGVGGEDGGGEGLARRRRDDPVLLDLARLTRDEKMEAFLLSGDIL